MDKMSELYKENLLFVFDKHLVNTDKSKMILVKDEADIIEIEDALTLHYSEDWKQYLDIVLPSNMRFTRKLLSYDECWQVIKKLTYGTLAFSTGGYPYVFGMNHVVLNGHIYFHCGPNGYKLEGINKKVTFNFIEDLGLNYEIGTHNSRSVSVYGTMKVVEDVSLKREILLKMLEDLKVNHVWTERMPITTNVLEIEIDYINGKEHSPKNYYEKPKK